jgi:hypothetical protein
MHAGREGPGGQAAASGGKQPAGQATLGAGGVLHRMPKRGVGRRCTYSRPEAGNEGDSSSSRLPSVSDACRATCVARSAPPVRYYGVLAFNSSWTPHSQLSRGLRRRTCAARPSVRVMVGRAAPARSRSRPSASPMGVQSSRGVHPCAYQTAGRRGEDVWSDVGARAPTESGGRPCPYVLAPFASCCHSDTANCLYSVRNTVLPS